MNILSEIDRLLPLKCNLNKNDLYLLQEWILARTNLRLDLPFTLKWTVPTLPKHTAQALLASSQQSLTKYLIFYAKFVQINLKTGFAWIARKYFVQDTSKNTWQPIIRKLDILSPWVSLMDRIGAIHVKAILIHYYSALLAKCSQT